jgi:hypothetical protein
MSEELAGATKDPRELAAAALARASPRFAQPARAPPPGSRRASIQAQRASAAMGPQKPFTVVVKDARETKCAECDAAIGRDDTLALAVEPETAVLVAIHARCVPSFRTDGAVKDAGVVVMDPAGPREVVARMDARPLPHPGPGGDWSYTHRPEGTAPRMCAECGAGERKMHDEPCSIVRDP